MPITFSDLDTESLSAAELKWCQELEKLLLKTPERFGLYVVGDADITCFDAQKMAAKGIEIEDGNSGNAKLNLALISSRVQISGLCA